MNWKHRNAGNTAIHSGRRAALVGVASLAAAMRTRALDYGGDVIVDTASGRLRGHTLDGVAVFKGIPYAASTAGANRFLPPQPVTPWAGTRDAAEYGRSAPQVMGRGSPLLSWYNSIPPISEDCLYLNVFAERPGHGTRRPVMVWLHGGGWVQTAGTAPGFAGLDLVKRGEVVLVSINHRLNLFGYIRLDDHDERFADSGNAGVLDMIAALRWVRQNIAAFGGDAGNVTTFGQSGGASKVAALMATPAAGGLIHKGISQSFSGGLRIAGEEEAATMTYGLVRQLGLGNGTGAALQTVPMENLIAALTTTGSAFRPVLDGRTFTRHPFDPDAPPAAAAIPLMAGNVADEARFTLSSDMRNFSLDADEVRRRIARFIQIDAAETTRILDAYRAADPQASPSDLLASIATDYMYIRNTRRLAELQSVVAPAYAYLFSWRTPVLNGVLRSPHAVEVPFVFGTAAMATAYIGEGADIAPLTRTMIATWSSFAHRGKPDNAMLPPWPRFDARRRATMLLNVRSRVESDPGGTARAALARLPYYEYSKPGNYYRA